MPRSRRPPRLAVPLFVSKRGNDTHPSFYSLRVHVCYTLTPSVLIPYATRPTILNAEQRHSGFRMPAYGLTDPAAYVVIITATAIIWSLLVLAIRVFLRLKVNGPCGWDDLACVMATARFS